MSDYGKLVETLRYCQVHPFRPCDGCGLFDTSDCINTLHRDAAAAIEALQAEVENWKIKAIDAADRYMKVLDPKRGEWKKISHHDNGTSDYECSACLGIIIDVPDDDEHPLITYCPMCGARMTVAANRCKHMDKNGFCLITSTDDTIERCVDGPCQFMEVQE